MNDYRKGTKLQMTAAALREGLNGPRDRRTGAYIGRARNGNIRVQRDGIKRPESYAECFWERAT